ncbi:hypothetical protein LguiB_021443 [Lonicera macranthoides]
MDDFVSITGFSLRVETAQQQSNKRSWDPLFERTWMNSAWGPRNTWPCQLILSSDQVASAPLVAPVALAVGGDSGL